MKRLLPVAAATAFSCYATAAVQLTDVVLANSKASLSLDANGRVRELKNVETSHNYVTGGTHAPWRMYYRMGDPRTGALDLEIEPDGQKCRITRERDRLIVRYDTLRGSTPRQHESQELQVGLTLRIELVEDRLIWTAAIDNREPPPRGIEVTEIWLPWISGLGDLGKGRDADMLYWPDRGGRRVMAPYRSLTEKSGAQGRLLYGGFSGGPELRLTYPAPASMQWFTFNNGEEGLYFSSHDRTLMTTCLSVAVDNDRVMSASMIKYPFVKAGETWTSEPSVLRLYRGDWHEAAKTYRAWAGTWMRKPDPPAWLRQAPGWVLPLLKGQSGHFNATYADLPNMMKQAQSIGINLLYLFGWVKQGFDNLYPEYDADEALGGEAGLRQALDEIRKLGGRTILYTQGQLIDPGTEFYRTKGHRIVAKDIWGGDYHDSYGGGGRGTMIAMMKNKWFGTACPGAEGWYEQLASQFEMVKGLSGDGILYDQIGGIPPYICFSKEHPHERPSLAVGPWKVKNMDRLRRLMKSRDPEFAFVMELVTDCYAGYADVIHSQGIGWRPEPESFGEMFRYTFPEPAISHRSGGPWSRRMQLGHAFALGLRFDASLRDATDATASAALRRMIELRLAHPELLLEGRFVDNEGFTCDNAKVSAHGFVAGDRLAVTLWNPTDTSQIAKISAPGYMLEKIEWQEKSRGGGEQAILPGDVAVAFFRRQ